MRPRCLTRCNSPIACQGWGYCRDRNRDGVPKSEKVIRAWQEQDWPEQFEGKKMDKKSLSYRDVHVATSSMPRTALIDLPFRVRLICTRSAGWELWAMAESVSSEECLAGEYSEGGLRIDVSGVVILDTLDEALKTYD